MIDLYGVWCESGGSSVLNYNVVLFGVLNCGFLEALLFWMIAVSNRQLVSEIGGILNEWCHDGLCEKNRCLERIVPE